MQRVAIGRALVRRPVDLSDGRAALLARRQAARRPAARAEAHPAGARRHHPLRHPRPDRGHDHGQPHRRHRRRAGWSRSARRARSTRTPANVYVATRLGQPAINLVPAGLIPPAPMPAGTQDRRRPHRASADRQGRRTAGRSAGSTGSSISATRTTCTSRVGGHEARHARRSRTPACRSGDDVALTAGRPALLRCRRQPDREPA